MLVRNPQWFWQIILNHKRFFAKKPEPIGFCPMMPNHQMHPFQKCWTLKVLANDAEPSNVPFPEVLNPRGSVEYYRNHVRFCSILTEPYKVLCLNIQNSKGSVRQTWTFYGSAEEMPSHERHPVQEYQIQKVLPNTTEPSKVLSKKNWTINRCQSKSAEPRRFCPTILNPVGFCQNKAEPYEVLFSNIQNWKGSVQ
jgi:hypothetical protein